MARATIKLTSMGVFLSIIIGCSNQPASVSVPPVDATLVARQLMGKWDTDRDAAISADEAADCPALDSTFKRFDRDGDGRLTGDEIVYRIERLYGEGVGMFSIGSMVKLDGLPLSGAEVKLQPLDCFGDTLLPASGVTRDSGRAMLSIAAQDLPDNLQGVRGVNAGLYRIEITHPTISIPAKYNTNSQLGREVSQDDQLQGLKFDLKSR